ncbi:MAG: 2-amino-5-chloromuconate deaminase CnbZ [Acidobacteriaceae bacterium]
MNIDNPAGSYFFQPGGTPYSSGVRAMPGYELTHITLMHPLPLAEGVAAIAAHLAAAKRPAQALCGLELRCPAPYSFAGFAAFNDQYRSLLQQHGMLPDGPNPVARTNIMPVAEALTEQTIHAFSYTIPCTHREGRPSFVISGAGELVEAALNTSAIVRPGETSADAMEEKASLVMGVMQSRLDALGVNWSHVTVVNIYTIHDIAPFLQRAILKRMGAAARLGVHWNLSRPPVTDIEFEMDMRGVADERYEDIR